MRYLLFCQSLWSISHNALQATFAPMPRDPIFIEISSSHELRRIEVRLETHLVFLLPIKKVFHSPMNVRWTLSMDLITYFMMEVRMTHTARLFVTCPKISNVFIDITENGFVWTRSICHNLKHPTGSRRSYIFVTDCVVSIYWPISKRHHHVLVFSFREGCHPMVDTQPPKTF